MHLKHEQIGLETFAISCFIFFVNLSAASAQPSDIAKVVMPACINTTGKNDWSEPFYLHEIRMLLPMKALSRQPYAATWPEGHKNARESSSNSIRDVALTDHYEEQARAGGRNVYVEDGFDIEISNHPAAIQFTLEILTDAFQRKNLVGRKESKLIMRSGIPPHIKKAEPEMGFWVWEKPLDWLSQEGMTKVTEDGLYDRVYQPVGFEDKLIFSCQMRRDLPKLNGVCRVFTALDTGQSDACARVSLEYKIFASELPIWRAVDTIVRRKAQAIVESPILFRTIDGKP